MCKRVNQKNLRNIPCLLQHFCTPSQLQRSFQKNYKIVGTSTLLIQTASQALCLKHTEAFAIATELCLSILFPCNCACLPDYHIVVLVSTSLPNTACSASHTLLDFHIDPSPSRSHIYSALLPLLTAGVVGTVNKAEQMAGFVCLRLFILILDSGETQIPNTVTKEASSHFHQTTSFKISVILFSYNLLLVEISWQFSWLRFSFVGRSFLPEKK